MQIGSAANNAYLGIQNGFESFNKHTQQIVQPNAQKVEEGIISHVKDKEVVESSVKSLKTADDMIGTLIDIMA